MPRAELLLALSMQHGIRKAKRAAVMVDRPDLYFDAGTHLPGKVSTDQGS